MIMRVLFGNIEGYMYYTLYIVSFPLTLYFAIYLYSLMLSNVKVIQFLLTDTSSILPFRLSARCIVSHTGQLTGECH